MNFFFFSLVDRGAYHIINMQLYKNNVGMDGEDHVDPPTAELVVTGTLVVTGAPVVAGTLVITGAPVQQRTINFYEETGPYGFLSNYHQRKCPIHYNGKIWPSAEHAFQGAKDPQLVQKLRFPCKTSFDKTS